MKYKTLKRASSVTRMSVCAALLVLVGPLQNCAAEERTGASHQSKDMIDADLSRCLRKIMQQRFFNLIDATDEQRERMSELLSNHEQKMRPVRQELRKEAIGLLELFANSDATDQQLTDRCMQVRARRLEWMDENIKTMLKVRSLMKPEQRRTLVNFIMGLFNGDWRRLIPEASMPNTNSR